MGYIFKVVVYFSMDPRIALRLSEDDGASGVIWIPGSRYVCPRMTVPVG